MAENILTFSLVILFGIIQALIPVSISILSIIYFGYLNKDNWYKSKTIITRYLLFSLLILLGIYFLYSVIFTDHELMFVYIFWPAPVGLSLIGISMVTWKNGIKVEKIIAAISIIVAVISLVGPFIFR